MAATNGNTTLNVSIHTPAADLSPGAVLATGTLTATTAASWRSAVFSSPIVVTGPYVVSVMNPGTDPANHVRIYSNYSSVGPPAIYSGRGEKLSRAYYSGGWREPATLYNNFDADFIFEPIVNYNVSVDFTMSETETCIGQPVELTNTSSPIFQNRFYNKKKFANYFNGTPDDTFTWTLADGSTTNTINATTLSISPGTKSVGLTASSTLWITTTCTTSQSASLEVLDDTTAPVPDNPTLVDITAECAVQESEVTPPTATDACVGTITATHNVITFPITESTTITWSYDDGNGNKSTQSQNVIITDITAPVPDKTTLADITAECKILESEITPPTATDNCSGTVSVSNNATFPITTQGTTVITWTFEDEHGNKSTQLQNVIIKDITAPVPDKTTLADITAECRILESEITPPTATDNCSGTVSVSNNATFPITTQGTTVITWTFEDEHGNKSTQLQNVIIEECSLVVNDTATSFKTTIYPNPFNDVITISVDQNIIEKILVYDMKGTLLYTQNGNTRKINLNLSHFVSGVYLIKVISGQKESVHKVVKK